MSYRYLLLLCGFSIGWPCRAADVADIIIHDAHVVTLDPKSRIAEAIALANGKIIAIGSDEDVLKLAGPKTRVIDADSKTVLPGLIDSHVHPTGAAFSEAITPLPYLKSIAAVQEYIREKVKTTPKGKWIVIRYAFPTRLDDARFPTKAELDAVSPDHPVLYHAGPAGVANSQALNLSNVTKDTPNPSTGEVVKDAVTGEPTGMLRNAYGVLKGIPSESDALTLEQKQNALKKLFAKYNAEGLTSVCDRNAGRGDLDLYLGLHQTKQLTVRVNVARAFGAGGTKEEIGKRLDDLVGKDNKGGPSNTGDEWVRIGPIKLFLDGGMLNGTAYMREPWPKGDTYQVTRDDYQGLLFVKPDQLKLVVTEAAKRKWQVTAHCAGERGMDLLLDAYQAANTVTPIKDLRFCITHANFPSKMNLERCQQLGVCADVQPVWLYKDGATLIKYLPEQRMRWFQPYKTWLEYTTIGGGSDHMLRYDPFMSTNPWSPWLGIWQAITRQTERGGVHQPNERLTREQALRLYTINNAYLHHEEKVKGSLEINKYADVIMIDRDVLTCDANAIRETKVLLTIVNGQVVHEAK